jgi:hypothetical protein
LDIADGLIGKLKYQQKEKHPVEKIQKEKYVSDEEFKLVMYAATYGLYMPQRILRERNFLGKSLRLPGLPASHLGTHPFGIIVLTL